MKMSDASKDWLKGTLAQWVVSALIALLAFFAYRLVQQVDEFTVFIRESGARFVRIEMGIEGLKEDVYELKIKVDKVTQNQNESK